MEWGSVADWFSGIVTTAGILISLYFSINKRKLKFELKLEGRGSYELVYSVINHSEFDVRVQSIMLSFRGNRFKKSEFSKHFDRFTQMKKTRGQEVLEINVLRQGTFQLQTIVEEENAKKRNNGGVIPYDQRLLYFDVEEFKKRQKFYVVLEVLAQDGKIYRSKPKKFKLSDITYLKADEDWSKI